MLAGPLKVMAGPLNVTAGPLKVMTGTGNPLKVQVEPNSGKSTKGSSQPK